MTSSLRKLENLALVARQMSTCLTAGLTFGQTLETLCARSDSSAFRAALKQARETIDQGKPISEALPLMEHHFPQFVAPFLRSAESSGNAPEAFTHLERLTDRLIPVFRVVRQLWLVPVTILLSGMLLRIAIMIYFGALDRALQQVWAASLSGAVIIAMIHTLKRTQVGRQLLDTVLTNSPFIGHASRAVSLSLFFQSLNFLYRAGGQEFDTMLQQSLASTPSLRIRSDLKSIQDSLEQGFSLPEALRAPRCFNEATRMTLANGALVGRLEQSLDQVTDRSTRELESQLLFTRLILARLMGFALVGSICATIAMLL